MRFFALLFALVAWSSQAGALVFDQNFKLSQIKDVDIHLVDNATGACWTNLKEVREYAEEKLRIRGVKTVESRMPFGVIKSYTLFIRVQSQRLYENGTGPCWGNTLIELHTIVLVDGITHYAVVASLQKSEIQHTNLNKPAIIIISDFFSELN